ncbi:MAG: type II toxin-antitoxin system HicB family antitoxin [Terriglobales bacterium]
MKFTVEVEQETDGRWIAEVIELPGTMTYGKTREEAMAKVQALALRVVADRLEHAEAAPELVSVVFGAA